MMFSEIRQFVWYACLTGFFYFVNYTWQKIKDLFKGKATSTIQNNPAATGFSSMSYASSVDTNGKTETTSYGGTSGMFDHEKTPIKWMFDESKIYSDQNDPSKLRDYEYNDMIADPDDKLDSTATFINPATTNGHGDICYYPHVITTRANKYVFPPEPATMGTFGNYIDDAEGYLNPSQRLQMNIQDMIREITDNAVSQDT